MGLNQGEVYSKSHPVFTTPRNTHNTGTVERPALSESLRNQT
jgi:hypothetical protein